MKKVYALLVAAAFLAACGDDSSPAAPAKQACETPASKSADVVVTSPNCGGSFKVGDTLHVKWATPPAGSAFTSAKVEVVFGNGDNAYVFRGSVPAGTAKFGDYPWAIPDSLFDEKTLQKVPAIGSGYRIVISDYQDSRLTDTSDVAFSIVGR